MKTLKYLLMMFVAVFLMACNSSNKNNPFGKWYSIKPDQSFYDWTPSNNNGNYHCSGKGDTLVMTGRNALYYSGELCDTKFKNFEMSAEIKTETGAVGGIWVHSGDISGYLIVINNTSGGEERRKTGSLSDIRNIYKSMAANDEWFTITVKIVDKHITVKVNELLIVDYVEPDVLYRSKQNAGMRLSQGTFALCNYTDYSIKVGKMIVKPLPDDEQPERTDDATDEQNDPIFRLLQDGFPVIDYHVHLKGWNQEQAMDYSRTTGIFYGIAPNCGLGFPITSDDDIVTFLDTTKNLSCFRAMQGEGREWVTTFSEESRKRFDYVFTDAMTFNDHKNRRTRLWIPEEVFIDISSEKYMDIIVDRIIKVLNQEPIDIYVNPTFLPEQMMPDYDILWTDARIKRVINALADNGIALEINARYHLPSEKIILAAKSAGIKFALGTNNGDANIGKLEYCIEMIEKCGITKHDMFFPAKE